MLWVLIRSATKYSGYNLSKGCSVQFTGCHGNVVFPIHSTNSHPKEKLKIALSRCHTEGCHPFILQHLILKEGWEVSICKMSQKRRCPNQATRFHPEDNFLWIIGFRVSLWQLNCETWHPIQATISHPENTSFLCIGCRVSLWQLADYN